LDSQENPEDRQRDRHQHCLKLTFSPCATGLNKQHTLITVTIAATRCQILRPNCTKFDFFSGAPDPVGGAYSAPRLTICILEAYCKGERGMGGERAENWRRGWRGGRERKGGMARKVCCLEELSR